MEKILIYNWVRPDRSDLAGGGVSVYIQGLIEILLRTGARIDFLAAGEKYHHRRKEPFIREDLPAPRGCKNSWEIINSGVKSPAHHMFGDPTLASQGEPLTNKLLADFFEKNHYDYVYINNVEGIPTEIFNIIRATQPSCKVIVVAHNYHLLCPQIELLYRGETRCEDYEDGKRCLSCLQFQPLRTHEIRMKRAESFKQAASPFHEVLTKGGLFLSSFTKIRPLRKDVTKIADLGKTIEADSAQLSWWSSISDCYVSWRKNNIDRLNHLTHSIICVSDIVRQQFIRIGVNPEKLHTIHLSMPCVEEPSPQPRGIPQGDLTVSYFGYDIPSKGLDIFLDALELIPKEVAAHMNILIVSNINDYNHRLLSTLDHKFKKVELLRRYSREQLPDLCARIDCNVAISRWWETYHQVTYEMINYGVPAFVSANMGISELYPDEFFFKLPEPDAAILANRLVELHQNRERFTEFHHASIHLPTPQEYAERLLQCI